MGLAFKCDRCETLYNSPGPASRWVKPEDQPGFKVPALLIRKGNRQDIDLCKVCELSFFDWWKSWAEDQAEQKARSASVKRPEFSQTEVSRPPEMPATAYRQAI